MTSTLKHLFSKIISGNGLIPAFLQTLLTQVGVLAINMATGILTARLLGAEGRGIFAAIVFWPTFIGFLFTVGLPNALTVQIRKAGDDKDAATTAGVVLASALGVLGGIVGAGLVWLFMRRQYSQDVVLFTMAATLVFAGVGVVNVVLRAIMIVNDRIGVSNKASWLNPALYLVFLLLALWAWRLNPLLAASAQLLAGGIIFVWLCSKMPTVFKFSRHALGPHLRALISYSSRVAPSDILVTLATNLDRLVLVPLLPSAQLGLYVAAYSLSRLFMILQGALSSVVLPALTKCRSSDEAKDLHDKIFRVTLYIAIAVALVVTLIGGKVMALLYGPDFVGTGPLLALLTAEAAISCVFFVPSQLFMSLGKPGYLSVVQTASFGVALVALLALVPRLGAVGAGAALALAALFRLAMILGGMPWLLKLAMPQLLLRPDDVTRIKSFFKRH